VNHQAGAALQLCGWLAEIIHEGRAPVFLDREGDHEVAAQSSHSGKGVLCIGEFAELVPKLYPGGFLLRGAGDHVQDENHHKGGETCSEGLGCIFHGRTFLMGSMTCVGVK